MFFIAIIILIISGVLMAVVPYWTAFALLRAAVGFSHPGIFVIAVVIGMLHKSLAECQIFSSFISCF